MTTDLLHNKIIKDTVTEGFITAFLEDFVPKLNDEYGQALEAVQMYEDYLNDGFTQDGIFYYPLTVVVNGEVCRRWIMWDVSEVRDFADNVPYSYIGDRPLVINFANEIPEGFDAVLKKRACYCEGGFATFKIQSVSDKRTFLAGKYSQTFIDELNRQISKRIESTFRVTGIEDSGVELLMVFAPGTYMEHVVENTTYRRLLITARGCAAHDFWIKWTNRRGPSALTVSDHVTAEDILFEIGEDVPQKIREKEYRFLVRSSADKYQSAMGRKNITEWRDLIKRVIKRGELVKNEMPELSSEKQGELTFKLNEVLSGKTAPVTPNIAPVPETVSEPEKDNSDLTALLRNVLGAEAEEEAPALVTSESAEEKEELTVSDILDTEEEETVLEEYNELSEPEILEGAKEPFEPAQPSIEELRKQIEAEIREKLVNEARIKAEQEAERLRREREELARENERLAALAKEAEEQRRAEAEKHRLEIEARELAEAREKERLAEAARLAVLEQQRLKEAQIENERREREEAERRKAEEEAKRIEEERRKEEARIRAELSAKAEAEKAAEAAKAAESEKRAKAAAAGVPQYTYTSKNARLLFRGAVDPNITKRIHEIILTTIKYFHKENVYIKIKATVPDPTTVNLHFVEIPEEETELLIQIIKVLGKSNLGITKVFLE